MLDPLFQGAGGGGLRARKSWRDGVSSKVLRALGAGVGGGLARNAGPEHRRKIRVSSAGGSKSPEADRQLFLKLHSSSNSNPPWTRCSLGS